MMNLDGRQFTRWTAVRFAERRNRAAFWKCLCMCGNTKIVAASDLLRGHSRSCGCLMADVARRTIKQAQLANVTHGHTSRNGCSSEYRSWNSMRQRCNNPKNDRYKDYGGRGIKVCVRWQNFSNFLADMGARPKHTSIDRINNDGNYGPENCRWATYQQQQRNGRRVKIVTRSGITGSFRDVCESLGLNPDVVRTRLNRGWSIDDAWTRPSDRHARRIAKPRTRKT